MHVSILIGILFIQFISDIYCIINLDNNDDDYTFMNWPSGGYHPIFDFIYDKNKKMVTQHRMINKHRWRKETSKIIMDNCLVFFEYEKTAQEKKTNEKSINT